MAVGFVLGRNYKTPWLSPFEEFQRYKTPPAIRKTFEGGRRIGYGARALTAGGLNSLPELAFPGGALLGCDAGFLNASRIKGSHAAIKSGMLAAEACFDALGQSAPPQVLEGYTSRFKSSWLHKELHKARNFKPAMSKGLWLGSLIVGVDQKLFGGEAPFTLHNQKPDHAYLEPASEHAPIAYPKPDGVLTFDRLSSVFLSGTNHEENQPAHLTLKDASVPVATNLTQFARPESRYCPAGVYEYLDASGNPVNAPSEGALALALGVSYRTQHLCEGIEHAVVWPHSGIDKPDSALGTRPVSRKGSKGAMPCRGACGGGIYMLYGFSGYILLVAYKKIECAVVYPLALPPADA